MRQNIIFYFMYMDDFSNFVFYSISEFWKKNQLNFILLWEFPRGTVFIILNLLVIKFWFSFAYSKLHQIVCKEK